MGWVLPKLGARAIVSAGYGVKDELREAIQVLSPDFEETTGYSHVGWVKHEGRDYFLHTGGAIGAAAIASVPTDTVAQGQAVGTGSVGPAGANPGADVAPDLPKCTTGNGCRNHSLGQTGANGAVPGPNNPKVLLRSIPPDALVHYCLPEPPSGDELRTAIRASLKILDLGADDAAIFSAYASIWRAPLGDADCCIYYVGHSGSFKSEEAALNQQHFGAGMDRKHLPGSWQNTANFNAEMSFYAKDCVYTIDDWVLRGSQGDMDKANREADRIIRGQGNGAGRGRCSITGKPRPVRSPRSLTAITAEAIPSGFSTVARLWICEFCTGQIDKQRLKACQNDAKAGVYAKAMAGYLQWMATDLDDHRRWFWESVETHRASFASECEHLRTASIAAELLAAFDHFLSFAREVGAIDEEENDRLWERMDEAIERSLKLQSREQQAEEPVDQYLRLIGELISSGRAHLASLINEKPYQEPERWGWAERKFYPKKDVPNIGGTKKGEDAEAEEGKGHNDDQWEEKTHYVPEGRRIGWVDDRDVYLLPSVSFAAAQELARQLGPPLPVKSVIDLGKELRRKGYLVSRDDNRDRNTMRKNAAGKRTDVYHLKANKVVRREFYHAPWAEEDWEGPIPTDLLDD